MIKFFRRIRQRLLSENKFTKYLIYAIGEIVLVVIGILIALWINSSYEKSKSEARFNQLLREVRNELAVNIRLAEEITEFGSLKDSVSSLVLFGDVSREQYETEPELRLLIQNYYSYYPKSNAFDRLMQNSSRLTADYDSLLDQLKTIYVTYLEAINYDNQRVGQLVGDYQDLLKRTKPWFAEYAHSPVVSKGFTDHMMNDPFYKNHVADYWILTIINQLQMIHNLRLDSYNVYRQLSEDLELKDELTPELMANFDLDSSVGHYVSKVDSLDFQVDISLNQERLEFTINDSDPTAIFPIEGQGFITGEYLYFGHFKKDNGGKVNGLKLRLGYTVIDMIKE